MFGLRATKKLFENIIRKYRTAGFLSVGANRRGRRQPIIWIFLSRQQMKIRNLCLLNRPLNAMCGSFGMIPK